MEAAEEQVKQAQAYKEEGNQHFSEGNYKKALSSYHKVILYLKGLQPAPEGSKAATSKVPEETQKLMQQTKLNMAACYLKVGEHQKCVDACSDVLQHGPSAKAHFRRGQAYLELRNFAGAKAEFAEVKRLEPENTEVDAELRKVKAAMSKGDAAERETYSKMFPAASASSSARCDAAAADQDVAANVDGSAAEALEVSAAPQGVTAAASADPSAGFAAAVRPRTSEVLDEARRPEFFLRNLTYAWQQTDEELKVYVPFDQDEELQSGVEDSQVEVEFGEWSALLIIKSKVSGRAPLGLRLGDFYRRVDPELCTCTVRGSRITLKLVKQEKEHWYSILQRSAA